MNDKSDNKDRAITPSSVTAYVRNDSVSLGTNRIYLGRPESVGDILFCRGALKRGGRVERTKYQSKWSRWSPLLGDHSMMWLWLLP